MNPQPQTPEQLAESLVTVGPLTPDGPHFARLHAPGTAGVEFGPYDNPGLARGDAEKAWRFLAEVVREARK